MDFTTINQFIDQHRDDALWSVIKDYYPTSVSEYKRILRQIKSRSDVKTFKRIGEIEQWLKQQ